jgi:hypothetical protein
LPAGYFQDIDDFSPLDASRRYASHSCASFQALAAELQPTPMMLPYYCHAADSYAIFFFIFTPLLCRCQLSFIFIAATFFADAITLIRCHFIRHFHAAACRRAAVRLPRHAAATPRAATAARPLLPLARPQCRRQTPAANADISWQRAIAAPLMPPRRQRYAPPFHGR